MSANSERPKTILFKMCERNLADVFKGDLTTDENEREEVFTSMLPKMETKNVSRRGIRSSSVIRNNN